MKLMITLLLVGATSWNWGARICAQAPETEEVKQTATINFPGGKLSEYIDLVRDTVPKFNFDGEVKPPNIFITAEARDVSMPSVEMTTTIQGALGILSTISNDNQNILVNEIEDVITISVDNRILTRVRVINGKQLLEKMAKEDLLAAIEIGMKMQGNDVDIELKLHEQTGLLFVKGTPDNTELVDQIVAELCKANGIGYGVGAPIGGAGGGGFGGGGSTKTSEAGGLFSLFGHNGNQSRSGSTGANRNNDDPAGSGNGEARRKGGR